MNKPAKGGEKPILLGDNFFFLQETAELTSTGSWYIDTLTFKGYWNKLTYEIIEAPDDYIPSLDDSIRFYADEHAELVTKLFYDCYKKAKEFDVEVIMKTFKGKEFWARTIGKPVFNEENKLIGIQGVFQNIDDSKKKEIRLESSVDTIASQNSRLLNFAYIVSHNLRSHTSNLQLIVNLLDSLEDPQEKIELLANIKEVSNSLNKTIDHLNEVATIQTNNKQEKKEVDFQKAFNLVTLSIKKIIENQKANITVDFTQLASINYISAYFESILLNLITNSIKYKHPDRTPVIHIRTFMQNNKAFMEVSDNGAGIDLELYGKQIFGMYKTFHNNNESEGIGLFLTKNQIESLGGKISVESVVGEGTKFTVEF